MSPLALNVFDITMGLLLVSFAIWGFIVTALTAWRGSAYSDADRAIAKMERLTSLTR